MSEQTAHKFYTDCSNDVDVKAYQVNYGAHREGMTAKEMADYYSQWAASGGYDIDLGPGRYNGPEICANAVAALYRAEPEKVKLLDVAAGTGFLGEELVKRGFNPANMDALDPAEGMLAAAKKKQVYQRFICDFMDDHRLEIKDDTYDCLAIAGGMGEGHIPSSSINEMIRVVKPGGHIVIVMREEYLSYVENYLTLEQDMKRLEQIDMWKAVSRDIVPNYSFGKNGAVFAFQVL